VIIRNPAVAGVFYPRNADELSGMIDRFLRGASGVDERKALGLVVPHAGYIYCGETQAHSYRALMRDEYIFIILGPNHREYGPKIAVMKEGVWKTPLGIMRIDSEMAESILRNSEAEESITAHTEEHSIEVQLPWMLKRFPGSSFVPILLHSLSEKEVREFGMSLKEAMESIGKSAIIIASSDFTHFGEVYGYTPVEGGISRRLNFIKEIDREAAEAIAKLAPERFLDTVLEKRATICGYLGIASMLYALKGRARKGEILHYSTSYEVSKDPHAIVGYCGIVIE